LPHAFRIRGASPKRLHRDDQMLPSRIMTEWTMLSDDAQLQLAREAMRRASETLARQAELLADEMESGAIADRGGPDALRLLAQMVRLSGRDTLAPAGSA
jgi:hypothetical protein